MGSRIRATIGPFVDGSVAGKERAAPLAPQEKTIAGNNQDLERPAKEVMGEANVSSFSL